MSNNHLNPRQLAFARNYVDNQGNASEAYRSAGYAPNGANVASSRLLANVDVKDEITRLRSIVTYSEASIRSHVTANLMRLSTEGKPDSVQASATATLAKSVGMLTERLEMAGSSSDVPALKSYTLDELVKLRDVMVNPSKAIPAPVEDVIDQPAD